MGDLLATTFSLGALLAFARVVGMGGGADDGTGTVDGGAGSAGAPGGLNHAWVAGSTVLFLLAVLSKESGITFPCGGRGPGPAGPLPGRHPAAPRVAGHGAALGDLHRLSGLAVRRPRHLAGNGGLRRSGRLGRIGGRGHEDGGHSPGSDRGAAGVAVPGDAPVYGGHGECRSFGSADPGGDRDRAGRRSLGASVALSPRAGLLGSPVLDHLLALWPEPTTSAGRSGPRLCWHRNAGSTCRPSRSSGAWRCCCRARCCRGQCRVGRIMGVARGRPQLGLVAIPRQSPNRLAPAMN